MRIYVHYFEPITLKTYNFGLNLRFQLIIKFKTYNNK